MTPAVGGKVLVVGDVMTDIIVKPEGPLNRGSDRRAAIRSRPGGSGANQAVWLGAMGADVRFVARVGGGTTHARPASSSNGSRKPGLGATDPPARRPACDRSAMSSSPAGSVRASYGQSRSTARPAKTRLAADS